MRAPVYQKAHVHRGVLHEVFTRHAT